LSLGRGRAEALRLAMLQVMRTPQQKSFLYWAPVILTGDPSPLPCGARAYPCRVPTLVNTIN
jgi:hypothetical protein